MTATPSPPRRETATPALVRLVFLGNSVFLAGIKADLISRQVETVTVESDVPDAADLIRQHEPSAVIFDLGAGYLDIALSLLHDRPDVLLIGMMPSSDQVLLLSAQQVPVFSVGDLLDIVQSHVRDRGEN